MPAAPGPYTFEKIIRRTVVFHLFEGIVQFPLSFPVQSHGEPRPAPCNGIASPLFAERLKRLPLPLGDQDKEVFVLLVQVVQRPAEGGQLLAQGRRPFFMGKLHMLHAHRAQPPVQQSRDLRAPLLPQLRQGILYGSVIFQNIQRIGNVLFEFLFFHSRFPPLLKLALDYPVEIPARVSDELLPLG